MITTLKEISQFLVVDAHQTKHRRMQVVDMDFIVNCGKTKIVRRPDRLSPGDTATGQPSAEPIGMVIAAGSSGRSRWLAVS